MLPTEIAQHVAALRTGAGFVARPDVYTLRLTGPDRVRYLNGMVTSDVATLAPGQGQLSIKATPRGRVEGMLRIRSTADAFLIDVSESSAQAVADSLVKMMIADDVTLGDGTPERAIIGVYGPQAAARLETVGLAVPSDLYASEVTADVTVVRDDRWGPVGYELHVPPDALETWQGRLSEAGATAVSTAALDAVRIEFGRPRDGVDIDTDTIPMEARLEEALNFEKGCYVGQEVIARAHNLGGVKHILVGLQFEGEPPPAGARLESEADGKATGEVTSVVYSPTLEKNIGLGFVRIAHQTPGTGLRVLAAGEDPTPLGRAVVATLPLVG